MMGVIPLEYLAGQTAASLGLDGSESFFIQLPEEPQVNQQIDVTAKRTDETMITFRLGCVSMHQQISVTGNIKESYQWSFAKIEAGGTSNAF